MSTSHVAPPSPSHPFARSRRFREKFLDELVALGLPGGPGNAAPVTDADLAPLPAPAQRVMRFARVVGRPRDWSFCARWDARFRMAPDKPWMPVEAWQYNTSLDVARIFHMRMRIGGVVPTHVRDLYVHGGGRMSGKLLDTFSIVDDASEKVTVGELVTYVNDAVLFAPSMLLHATVKWLAVDDGAFDVALTDHGATVTARVHVDAAGAITDFSTTDRFGEDPAHRAAGLVRTRWTTPIEGGWITLDGRRLPARARAVWHFPSGDFCYVEFETAAMTFAFNIPPGVTTP